MLSHFPVLGIDFRPEDESKFKTFSENFEPQKCQSVNMSIEISHPFLQFEMPTKNYCEFYRSLFMKLFERCIAAYAQRRSSMDLLPKKNYSSFLFTINWDNVDYFIQFYSAFFEKNPLFPKEWLSSWFIQLIHTRNLERDELFFLVFHRKCDQLYSYAIADKYHEWNGGVTVYKLERNVFSPWATFDEDRIEFSIPCHSENLTSKIKYTCRITATTDPFIASCDEMIEKHFEQNFGNWSLGEEEEFVKYYKTAQDLLYG